MSEQLGPPSETPPPRGDSRFTDLFGMSVTDAESWDPGPLYERCTDPTCYPPHMPPPGPHYHHRGESP